MALNKMQKMLKTFAKQNKFELLLDLNIEYKTAQSIPAVLVSPFGISVFNCLCFKKGDLYGNRDDEKWTIVSDKERKKVENLFLENEKSVALLREIFAKEGVYKVGARECSVVECPKPDKQINLQGVLTVKDLKKYFKTTDFYKQSGCDAKKIVESIKKYER